MATYRTAIVGGRRGVHHARAYEGLENMQVVAICEVDEERRTEAVEALNVNGYADYEEMLDKEQPDIVHAVTMPTVPRSIWVTPAAEAGVQALVIEKPIALRPQTAEDIVEAQRNTGLKIIVNHQRRYMDFAAQLTELLQDGLGEIHFIRASTQGEITDMDTHLMDLVLFIVGDVSPTAVWATVEGNETYQEPILDCPENLIATYTFPDGIRVFFESARRALGTVDFPNCNPRCNFDIWATNGRFWWRENGTWGYQTHGMPKPFVVQEHFGETDMPAQRAFTQAIATWLDNENIPHLCRFELAKRGFDAIMAAYRSALLGRRISCEQSLTDAEWEQLRDRLTA